MELSGVVEYCPSIRARAGSMPQCARRAQSPGTGSLSLNSSWRESSRCGPPERQGGSPGSGASAGGWKQATLPTSRSQRGRSPSTTRAAALAPMGAMQPITVPAGGRYRHREIGSFAKAQELLCRTTPTSIGMEKGGL